jgi:hypothetical protein
VPSRIKQTVSKTPPSGGNNLSCITTPPKGKMVSCPILPFWKSKRSTSVKSPENGEKRVSTTKESGTGKSHCQADSQSVVSSAKTKTATVPPGVKTSRPATVQPMNGQVSNSAVPSSMNKPRPATVQPVSDQPFCVTSRHAVKKPFVRTSPGVAESLEVLLSSGRGVAPYVGRVVAPSSGWGGVAPSGGRGEVLPSSGIGVAPCRESVHVSPASRESTLPCVGESPELATSCRWARTSSTHGSAPECGGVDLKCSCWIDEISVGSTRNHTDEDRRQVG